MVQVKLVDYNNVDGVEIKIDSRNNVWVNIDGMCALRVKNAKEIVVEDDGVSFQRKKFITVDMKETFANISNRLNEILDQMDGYVRVNEPWERLDYWENEGGRGEIVKK